MPLRSRAHTSRKPSASIPAPRGAQFARSSSPLSAILPAREINTAVAGFALRDVLPVRPVSMRYPLSKFTAAVILPSPATLAPWGDDGWRFAGAMQLVADGPDWLYAQWPSLDGTQSSAAGGEPARFASLVLRDLPPERAEDIAVMAFALLGVDGWRDLEHWWGVPADRKRHRDHLVEIAGQYAGQYKLAVMVTADSGVAPAMLDYLEDLGFGTKIFTASETT